MGTISHLLNKTIVIKRNTLVDAGGGDSSYTEGTVATVQGRRTPLSTRERINAGTLDGEVSHAWYLESGVDVKVQDKIYYGTTGYLVLALAPPSDEDSHMGHQKAMTQEIQVGETN